MLAQCRFHRISKMTSSNPPHFTPSLIRTRSISPWCLAHLPPSSLSRSPPFLPLEPFHTPPRSPVLPHKRALPYLYPLTLPFLTLPTARVVLHHTPIFRQSSRAMPLFLSPSSSTFLLPFPAFRPYELSTGAIPMDKSGYGLLSTFCSTDQARIPTNRNAGGL